MSDMPPIEYWLPWWWDYPDSVPIQPVHPAARPQGGATPPVAQSVPTPPTAQDILGGSGGGPPPAAGAAATVALEAEELKRLKKRNSRVFNR